MVQVSRSRRAAGSKEGVAVPPALAASHTRAETLTPNRLLLLATISMGGILAPLNSTMLAVGLPEIKRAFAVSTGQVSWLVSAYLIAMAVAQPLGGRIGDQLGRARVFRAGLVSFFVLSVAAAFAPTFPLLVLLRTCQALTGAAVIPNGMAMLRESVPSNELGRTTGITSATISISAAVGPVLGAALLGLGSWRLVFLVNVPLVAVALACQFFLHYRDNRPRTRFVADWIAAVCYAALLVVVTLLLNALRGGQTLPQLAIEAVALCAFTGLFLYRQRTGPLPLAEWRLFRDRSYAAATAYIMLSNLVMYTTLLTIPFFIKEVQHKGNGAAGALLASMSILMAVLAPIAGQASDRFGRRLPTVAGSLVAIAGVGLLLTSIGQDVSLRHLALCLGVMGFGVGLSTGPAGTAAIETAPRALAGAAAGANSMMRYIGSILGAGVLGAVLNAGAGAPDPAVFRLIFAVLLPVAALAAVSTLWIHRFAVEAATGPHP